MSEVEARDRFGRRHRSLRVSVTDRCNLRCTYCMPEEGIGCVPRAELLRFEEIREAVTVAVSMGIDRIRITGGEPLLRRDLAGLIEMLHGETGLKDLALTTNGLLLERQAQALAKAGLKRINVSLDSLERSRFEKITRFDLMERAWRGIEAAQAEGLGPIRINTLLLAGVNDDEVERWLALTMERAIDVRFMELMPIGEGARLKAAGHFVNLTRLRKELEQTRGLVRAEEEHKTKVGNGPARYWRLPEAKGRVGFITPMSNSYCGSCSRMRLTSTGELRACLAFDEQVSIREALRRGDREAVRAGFLKALLEKKAGHHWRDGQVTEAGMSALGG